MNYSPPARGTIRATRLGYNLTQKQCAEIIGVHIKTWQAWEQGLAKMHPTFWRYFLIKLSVLDTEYQFEKTKK